MSITFVYAPVKNKKTFPCGISDDRNALEEVFGILPREFNNKDIPQLRAMGSVQRHHGHIKSLFDEIANAIETHGPLVISTKY